MFIYRYYNTKELRLSCAVRQTEQIFLEIMPKIKLRFLVKLLNRDRLCQVARFIDIQALGTADVVSQQL